MNSDRQPAVLCVDATMPSQIPPTASLCNEFAVRLLKLRAAHGQLGLNRKLLSDGQDLRLLLRLHDAIEGQYQPKRFLL